MNHYPQEPEATDVVLGTGHSSIPDNAAVLGGLEGLRQRLLQGTPEQRIEVLRQAMKYGETGVDVVVTALENPAIEYEIRNAAYKLLKDSSDERVKQAIAKYDDENFYDFYGDFFDEYEEYQLLCKWEYFPVEDEDDFG